jgi:putative DNA primase/helicase
MAVLEGNQGEGKSMSLGMLVGPRWFVDRLGDINNKDVIDQMLGKWLIEVSELDSIRGRELEAVKAFVSRQVDRARLSYARRAEDYPRQCIFIGSTNDQEYLTDPTGNRRYWPVKVGTARRKWLARTRDQLWAEAKFRYELGEKLYLPKELEEVAKVEQEKRFEVDPWEGLLKNIVEKEEGDGVYQTVELFRALTMSIGTPSLPEGHRIGKIMQRLGFRRSAKRIEGVLHRCWTKQRSWKEG